MCTPLSLVVLCIIVQIYPRAKFSQDKCHVCAWDVFNEIVIMTLFNPPSLLLMPHIMLLFICVSWEMYRYSVVIRSYSIITRNCAVSFQFCVCAYVYVWVREGHYQTREVARISGYYQIVAVLQSLCQLRTQSWKLIHSNISFTKELYFNFMCNYRIGLKRHVIAPCAGQMLSNISLFKRLPVGFYL
jgi:hypothetical protein